jgi:hypothetical protein
MNSKLKAALLMGVAAMVLLASSLLVTYKAGASGGQTELHWGSKGKNVGRVPREVATSTFMGPVDSSAQIRMLISFETRDKNGLSQLMANLYDPASPEFHHWLTAKEFGTRFGRSPQEFNMVANWLRGQGFNVDITYSNRLAIGFTGATDVIERAFKVQMAQYWDSSKSKPFYSNVQAPTLPAEISSITSGLMGLNNAVIYHHPVHSVQSAGAAIVNQAKKGKAKTGKTSDGVLQGQNFMGPSDLANVYGYQSLQSSNIQGQGQRIGIIIDSDVSNTDMSDFRTQFGLPAANLVREVLPGLSNPGITQDGELEADLDTQAISGVLPQAEIDLITVPELSGVAVITAEQDVVNLGAIRVVNESFGGCETDSFNTPEQTLFNQAATEGIAFFAAAGDSGAECAESPGTRGINCPVCYGSVTAVGGTEITANFNSSGNLSQLLSETVWNDSPGIEQDCAGRPTNGGATGGGISTIVPMPSYQVSAQGFAAGVPSGSTRVVPDVAALAGSPFTLVFSGGQPNLLGGTSLSSPLWAGMMGLINQVQGSAQGSPNTVLYKAAVSQYGNGGAAVFRDITSGNNNDGNIGSCDPDGVVGFSAGTGFDAVSGWGAPTLSALVQSFGSGSGGTCTYGLSPASQSFGSTGGSGSVSVTAGSTCGWSASPSVSWISITSGASGAGNGTVSYSVATNSGTSEQTGSISIAGQTFSITESGTGSTGGQTIELAVDGGVFQDTIGQDTGGLEYGVNRLTPATYPASLQQVKIYFASLSGVNQGDSITLAVGSNPSGGSNLDGISFQTVSATVGTLDSWNLYTVPNLTISSGDFVVGFEYTAASGVFPFAEDQSPPLEQRSYVSSDGANFFIVDTLGDGSLAGNLGIRAEVTEGGGGGGGGKTGGSPPAVSNFSGILTLNVLTLTGSATDTGGNITKAEITLQDANNKTLDDTGQFAAGLGTTASANFLYQIADMENFPTAVSATIVLTDAQGNHSTAVSTNFGNAAAGGPNISSASFSSTALTVVGGTFSGGLQLEVNGEIVAPPISIKVKGGGTKLKIAGSAKLLNMNKSGPNRIRVIDNGLPSNIFVLVK